MALWAGLVRVSHMGSRREGADDFHADRDQIRLIEGAVPSGDTVRILPPELNVSGGLPLEQRPSLLAAVEGVERGEFAGIIVGYLSRLGRNVKEQLRTYDRVHAAGGRIIVAQEGIDARTRGGRLQRTILAAIHEDEREQHVERFDNLRRWATEAGIWQRRQTPTGYRRDPDSRRLVPDERAPMVRATFRRRVAGEGLASLARFLGMTPSGVARLLENRVYVGEVKVGPYVNPAAHEPLVEEGLWLAAQVAKPVRPPRSAREPALLAGLVRCAGCGHMMSRGTTKAIVYSCHGRQHSAGPCPAPAGITVARLDEYVERVALAHLAGLVGTPGEHGSARDAAKAELAAAENELAHYLEAVEVAGLAPGEFASGARSRKEAVDEARVRYAHATAEANALPVGLVEDWPAMSATHRNAVLRGLIEAVVVRRVGRGRLVPVVDRVRILRHGAGLVHVYRGGGFAQPIAQLPWLDADDPRVLGEALP